MTYICRFAGQELTVLLKYAMSSHITPILLYKMAFQQLWMPLSVYDIYLCDKALLFAEEDKIVLGNVTEIGITSLHGSNDDTKESLPCVLNLRVPNIPMKTSLVQLVEKRLLLLPQCFSKYSRTSIQWTLK